jgi:hypothetical protein
MSSDKEAAWKKNVRLWALDWYRSTPDSPPLCHLSFLHSHRCLICDVPSRRLPRRIGRTHTHTHTHTHTQSLHTVMSEKLVGNFAISFWMQRAKKCVFPDSDSTWLQCNTISFHTNIGCLLCILSKWRKETRKAFAYTEYKMVWIQGNPVFKTCCSHFCEQWEHLFQLDPPSCFRPSK